jgi:hypothetical protein
MVDGRGRQRAAAVENGTLRPLKGVTGTYDLARRAIAAGRTLASLAAELASPGGEDYGAVMREKRLLSPVSHPDPAHCIVTGTGLTHLGSASARDAMHAKLSGKGNELTDSLKMFKMGIEGGKPMRGRAGVQPEWFYKGDGSLVAGPGEALVQPSFALDGGEEPELAGIYLIDPKGRPMRLGFALGNEFSDHIMERQNYLYLAHSKLRHCAIGPELVTGKLPAHIEGMSRILRKGQTIWEKPFLTGEANMTHTIANLEHHHFKYAAFRRPGDLHIHFFGTGTLSVADGVRTQHGDVFEISSAVFGAPLRNPLRIENPSAKLVAVKAL